MKLIDLAHVNEAVNESCTCGGGGPGACCPACEVWHRLQICEPLEIDYKTLHELEERMRQQTGGDHAA